jgi:Metallo-peptidase family M12
MNPKLLILLSLMAFMGCSNDQNNQKTTFETVAPFTVSPEKKNLVTELNQEEVNYDVLELHLDTLKKIIQDGPNNITLILPTKSQSLELNVSKVDIFTHDFKVILASKNSPVNVKQGLHYQGIIKGEKRSVVAISFFDNEVMGLISSDTGNLVLGKLKGEPWTTEHIVYNDKFVLRDQTFECVTLDDGVGYKKTDLEAIDKNEILEDCVRFYIEVDNDIYIDKGGEDLTYTYVTGLLNQVKALYDNEDINSIISGIRIWDVPSPYYFFQGNPNASHEMLTRFQATTGAINGDLAQLISFKETGGGVAAGIGGLCNINPDKRKSFSSIKPIYSIVPTFSWSVQVITHEFGHLMSSRHTQACVWNGDDTAIDGCALFTEGNCTVPEGFPQEGGTIMSYCHLRSVGINFMLGFGEQPGNVIRNYVAKQLCTTDCDQDVVYAVNSFEMCFVDCDDMEVQNNFDFYDCLQDATAVFKEAYSDCELRDENCRMQATQNLEEQRTKCKEDWENANKEVAACRNYCTGVFQ